MSKKRTYRIIETEKEYLCDKCCNPLQVREHKVITQKQLNQPFYYSKWYTCTNKDCKTTQIMPKKYIVWNVNKTSRYLRGEKPELERQTAFLKSI